MVYHANYLRYMERGRTEFFRLAGISKMAELDERRAHRLGAPRSAGSIITAPRGWTTSSRSIPMLTGISGRAHRGGAEDLLLAKCCWWKGGSKPASSR